MDEIVKGEFKDVMVISELRGRYPNVPISPDVDYESLTAGDDDPKFVTLPIGKVNVRSKNSRYYDDAWVAELERQVLSKKPVGLMGHLDPNQRAWAFPEEAVHWVGTLKEQDTGLLWGKAYVVPGPARERMRRYTASGKSIATSIACGPSAEGIWDESVKAYRMKANTMELEQIDIAPADRAGIPDLASVPVLTREMESNEDGSDVVDKYEVIKGMVAEDAKFLPDAVLAAILEMQPPPETPSEVKTVAEVREILGIDENSDLLAVVSEMRKVQIEREKNSVKEKVQELATAEDTGIKVDSIRTMVVEMVMGRNPATTEQASQIYNEIVQSDYTKNAIAAVVETTMGPAQRGPVQPKNSNGAKGKYFLIPEEDE